MSFFCAGSDFNHPPVPGVDDFPRIMRPLMALQAGGFYRIFNKMSVQILTEAFSNASRSQTFTVPIYIDDVPEGVEEFNLTLTLLDDPTLPPRSVSVAPAVATVRIRDLSCKFIK